MARSEVQKSEAIDRSILLAASRLRLRALALVEGAMSRHGVQKATLAKRLGVRRSAVQHTLAGNGNMTLQTLAEYLGALGMEVELVPVEAGEVSRSMRERRAPRVYSVTLRDRDWDSRTLAVSESSHSSQAVWGAGQQAPLTAMTRTQVDARGARVRAGVRK